MECAAIGTPSTKRKETSQIPNEEKVLTTKYRTKRQNVVKQKFEMCFQRAESENHYLK